MNIYKRQMERLGLNLEQYSKLVGMPIEITKKIINEKEVVEDMQVNNFLRNNIFNKHQEIEKEENKTQEAINIKLNDSDVFSHPKIQNLIQKYPNSEELYWYLTKFNRDEYFEKYNVASYQDLMRRYEFISYNGRIKGRVCHSTVVRVISRLYDEVGEEVIYELAKQLYDCFEKGNIKEIDENNTKKFRPTPRKKEIKITQEDEDDLRIWYKDFDFHKFIQEHDMTVKEFGEKVCLAESTTFAFFKKYAQYKPSTSVLQRVKDFVESCDKIVEQITMEEEIMCENPIYAEEVGIEFEENDMLKELLKERLTEQEKYLIRLFGGNI